MPKIASVIWLAFAGAACGIDSRNPGIAPDESATAEPAPGGAGGQPGGSALQPPPAGSGGGAALVPRAGSGGTAPTPASAGASGASADGGTGNEPVALDPMAPIVPDSPSAPPAICANPSVSFDALFQLAQADLLQLSPADQVFARYVSITNRVDAGDCAEALEEQRAALIKALNMLSLNPVISVPISIDAARTVYRINLRDYAWDRAIEVEGAGFANVWEAIAAADPFAVPFSGPDADALNLATGTGFPILFADQLSSVAMAAPLYYAIIGVDSSSSVSSFILNDLRIDLAQNLSLERSLRAGTTRSTVSRRPRIVQRDELEVTLGVLWQVFDLASDVDTFSTEDLLGLPATDGAAIFTLPNGMLGFLVFDPTGAIVADSNVVLDANLPNFRALSAVSCSNCHSAGFIPVVDEAKAAALSGVPALSADESAQLQAIYAEPNIFALFADEDSAAFQSTLRLAGLTATETDPVSQVFFRFGDDLTLAAAAGELGVTAADLSANLDVLQPALGVLRDGVMDRDDFAAAYVDSLCILSIVLANQPDAAACAAAQAAAN